MKAPSDSREISIELSPLVVNRLREFSLGQLTLAEEAVRMLRYAIREMFPPRTPLEWKNFVKKEDWKYLLQTLTRKSKKDVDQDVPGDQPYKVMLEVPLDIMDKVEEIAQSKQITVSEAAVYTIEYAFSEVFPPKTQEELTKELRETWRGIFRTIWKRS